MSERSPSTHMCDLPMMIVFSAQYIDVKRHAGRDGERIEYVGEHLGREVSNLFSLQPEISDTEWARAYVYHCSRERLGLQLGQLVRSDGIHYIPRRAVQNRSHISEYLVPLLVPV